MKKKITILGMVVVLMLGLFGCGNTVNVKGQKLSGYSYSHGGGMLGGFGAEEVVTINNQTYLCYREAKSYIMDEVVTEYAVDEAILSDIEAIFKKHKMNRWNQKKFTNMFVSDGENYSYNFYFNQGEIVYFSSQIYPAKYSNKLNEIDEVIEKYRANATLLPGLVVKEKTSEEYMYISSPDNGTIEIEVYEYYKGHVYYRIMNGTEKEVEIPGAVILVSNKDNKELYNKDNNEKIQANSTNEDSIRIDDRLDAGVYTLYVGEYECEFEIN